MEWHLHAKSEKAEYGWVGAVARSDLSAAPVGPRHQPRDVLQQHRVQPMPRSGVTVGGSTVLDP